MAYKIDDRIICFTLKGIILANNECNSMKLNMKHFTGGSGCKLTKDVITAEISRRRDFNNAVIHAVHKMVMDRMMQQDKV
jgi:hypothetical protein